MKTIHGLVWIACSLALLGCSASKEEELRQWMAQENTQHRSKITPLVLPKQFQPVPYDKGTMLDPFNNQRLTQALRRDTAQTISNGGLVAPELLRRKEPLEAFALDTMAMVGSVVKNGAPTALIRVDRLLYQVKVGDHLGQNYGRITKISESAVSLREVVQDSSGEWVERTARLELQEKTP